MPSQLAELLPAPLLAQCESASYPAGTALFLTGDRPRWMYFVHRGEVVLERHGLDGRTACLQRCQSGFAGEASLTSGRYHCDCRTTRETGVTMVPIKILQQTIRHDSAFAERWISMLSHEVRRLRLQNERLSLPRIQERLIHLIETEGRDGTYQLTCPLTQLARQLAVTHEALYRAIAQLVAAGRMERHGNRMTLRPELPRAPKSGTS